MDTPVNTRSQVDVRQRLYRPLCGTEFRVVHILPGHFLDDIQCIIETRSTKVKCRYEALSYQWGDESDPKFIRIASSDSTTQADLNRHINTMPARVFASLKAALERLRHIVQQYTFYLNVLVAVVASASFYTFWNPLSSFPLEQLGWPFFSAREVYTVLVLMVYSAISYVSANGFGLISEVLETKSWGLIYDSCKFAGNPATACPFRFEYLPVTKNLELAMRYLRRENGCRTLWIDALCIDQENEVEKATEVQRMDWIYANASPVVIWIGGYHGVEQLDSCIGCSTSAGPHCEHRQQIQKAFDHVWLLSGWRLMLQWYFTPHQASLFRDSRSGFLEIASRGWWERLWVIQEASLATGLVWLQCGHSTCKFEDFEAAEIRLDGEYFGDDQFQNAFRSCWSMHNTIKEFRYSPRHDRGRRAFDKPLPYKRMIEATRRLIRFFDSYCFCDGAPFHEQSFARKLNRILLKTAGRFSCRDERDRLYAVLGIAGGGTTRDITKFANLVEKLNRFLNSWLIIRPAQLLLDRGVSSLAYKCALMALCTASLLQYMVRYEFNVKHWTISRPSYIVTRDKGALDAVTGSGRQANRVEFFTAIAGYLASETKSLSFLEAANCGEDKDSHMPSWVPNWSRSVDDSAYEFISRIKGVYVTDSFELSPDGTSLELAGQSRGTVSSHWRVRPRGTAYLAPNLRIVQTSLWRGIVEKVFALDRFERAHFVFSLSLILIALRLKPFFKLIGCERALLIVCYSCMKELVDRGCKGETFADKPFADQTFADKLFEGKTLADMAFAGIAFADIPFADKTFADITYVDIQDGDSGCFGELRAGEVRPGDVVVSVPGCFNHLVLRKKPAPTSEASRWKLVGLVDIVDSPDTREAQTTERSQSKSSRLPKSDLFRKYTIV